MPIPRPVKDLILATWALSGGRTARRLADTYQLPGGYERVYFYHIRKTAGTSLNRAFIALGSDDVPAAHLRLQQSWNKRIIVDGKVIVGHNRYLIQQGRYFYAFSHHPWDELVLPPKTFRITCLRDPVRRAVSHYTMLAGLVRRQAVTRSTSAEQHWAAGTLSDFIDQAPREHLLRQLYMFSARLDVNEAADRLRQCSYILHTEQFEADVSALGRQLNLPLQPRRERVSPPGIDVDDEGLKRLRELLQPEYELLARLEPAAAET